MLKLHTISVGFCLYFFASQHILADISLRSKFDHKFSIAQTMNP